MIAETLKFARGSPKFWETLVEYRWTEVVNLFNYLGNMISYEEKLDIDNK